MTPSGTPWPRRRPAAAAAAAAAVALLLSAFLLLDTPPAGNWAERAVVVARGSHLADVVSALRKGGVLPHPLAFRALAFLTRTDRRLQHGEYSFPTPPSAYEVWDRIHRGNAKTYKVTVPPGANLYDVAALVAEKTLAGSEAFLSAATSPAVIARLAIPGDSAEGYLYPETYIFRKPVAPEEIVEEMVGKFREKFARELARKAKDTELSLHEVVTIASIIEKETGVEEERPLVSAVIRRRLALGMPLQMDPTVIYGVKRFDGTVTRKDLRTPGPYNTYLRRGLPPGPIANPGLNSLAAALEPAETEYLYFVSRNDGSHTFSKTLPEHNRAVERLRRALREEEEG
ncbi:MAG: endolytic transglycosylase MltG [Deltaproteobacteria bacterium]|nr:MAG: endolytic transglycosylase MltG [Deltaproteobacteria bacterium]